MNESDEPSRPSQADVARAAGVSPMTVSLSLRNHPSIPESTRARIRRVADELGYKPDPLIGKLMQQLRMGGRRRASFSLCFLAPRPTKPGPSYQGIIAAGARKAAQELGFFFDTVEIDDAFEHPARLRRMLHSRGVEGLILGPQFPPADLTSMLDWSQFSVVSTSHSVLGPAVHRVVPNQFANALLLGRELNRQGHRRLGLLISRDLDERTGHRLDAAIQWLNHENGVRDLETFRWETAMPSAAMLDRWVKRHHPDVLISDTSYNLEMFRAELPRLEAFPMAATSTIEPEPPFDSILENPEDVGAAAVDLVSMLFQRGERGLPQSPRTLMVEGVFRPARKKKGRRKGPTVR